MSSNVSFLFLYDFYSLRELIFKTSSPVLCLIFNYLFHKYIVNTYPISATFLHIIDMMVSKMDMFVKERCFLGIVSCWNTSLSLLMETEALTDARTMCHEGTGRTMDLWVLFLGYRVQCLSILFFLCPEKYFWHFPSLFK